MISVSTRQFLKNCSVQNIDIMTLLACLAGQGVSKKRRKAEEKEGWESKGEGGKGEAIDGKDDVPTATGRGKRSGGRGH